jgi:phosphotransferase system enzyme I (PtsI)
MLTITGTSIFSGVAIGPIRFFNGGSSAVERRSVTDTATEIQRFEVARAEAINQLSILYQKALEEVGEANAAIFEIHQMMLDDQDYRESIIGVIQAQSVNVEYAISVTEDNFARIFTSMDDAYMQGRAADVRDVSKLMQKILNPVVFTPLTLETPSIVAARDLAPSETVRLDRNMILGLATAEGSANSHTAILARTMGIPAVIGAGGDICEDLDGRPAILDGFTGTLYVEPDAETNAMLLQKQQADVKKRLLLEALKGTPNVTLDGRKIDVFANAGSVAGVGAVLKNDAGGIGLFRSELLYLESKNYPTEQDLFAAYRQVAESMGGKNVIIRTMDIGADKQINYFNMSREENPAMGMRAIRICLTRPEIFKTQLRALFRASAFGNISIMFPMIISVSEMERIAAIVTDVKEELRRDGIPFREDVEIGIMIETPAAVMISKELAEMVDFFSIGTNDLTQYTLAIDRQNRQLDQFYDARHPAVLRMIEMVVQSAHAAKKWVGICGELAADTELTETFLRMGVDELSVSAGLVLKVREKIRSLDLSVEI